MADPKLEFLPELIGSGLSLDDVVQVVDMSADVDSKAKTTVLAMRTAMLENAVVVTPSGGDDTDILQTAMDDAVDGTVIVLMGGFQVSDTVTLAADGVSVVGIGASVTQTGTDKPTLKLNGVSRCRTNGIRFLGKGTETPWAAGSTTANNVAGVLAYQCEDCDISNNIFANHAGSSIVLDSTAANISILNNRISGVGSEIITLNDNGADAGIRGTATSIAKQGLTIQGNNISGHCFGILMPGVVDMNVIGNVIHDIPGQHGMYITECGDAVIANNLVYDTAINGIKVQHQLEADAVGTISIVGNTVKGAGPAANGIGISVNATGVAVIGAYFQKAISISGNNVNGCGYGIYVLSVKNCSITGNRVSDCSLFGYYARYAEASLRGNYVANCERAPLMILNPTNTIVVDGMTILDGPRNVAEYVADYTGRAVIYVDDEAGPDNGYVYLTNILAKFENYSAKAGTGALYGFIYATANTQLYLGPCVNLTGAANTLAGSEVSAAVPA